MDDDILKAAGPKLESSPTPQKHVRSSQPDAVPPDPSTIFNNIYNYPWEQDLEFQSGLSAILKNNGEPAPEGETHQDVDLMLHAQCFYFSRKYNLPTTVNVAAYKSWLNAQVQDKTAGASSPDVPAPHARLDDSPHHPFAPKNQAPPLPPNPPPLSFSTASFSSRSPQIPTSANPSHPSPPVEPQQTSQQPSNSQTPGPPYPNTFASIVDLITRNEPIPGIEQIPNTVLDASLSPPNTTPRRKKPWEKEETNPERAVADSASADGGDNIANDHHDDEEVEENDDDAKEISTNNSRMHATTQRTNGTHASADQQVEEVQSAETRPINTG